MKITFALPQLSLAGGIRVCAIYADYLSKRGHEVSVVSSPAPELPLVRRIKNAIKGKPTKLERGPHHFEKLKLDLKILDRARPIVDADVPDADIIIATWWETAHWVAGLSPTKGAKVHLIQHDETQMPFQDTKRVEEIWSLPTTKVVVAQWLAEMGEHRFGAQGVKLVPNGVDTNLFDAPPRGKQKVPTVGLMYSHTPFKGSDIALEAFELASKNVSNLKLIAFGPEPVSEKLPLPEGTRFELQPKQEAIRDVYASCDAWLFASRSEGYGLPILEAMACRTPVIGTPTGAAPELIGEGGGMLVKPQDAIGMARAIETIARMSVDEWTLLSNKAYATAQSHTWQNSCELFEQILIEAAG